MSEPNKQRVLILGNEGVGKTALHQRALLNLFHANRHEGVYGFCCVKLKWKVQDVGELDLMCYEISACKK